MIDMKKQYKTRSGRPVTILSVTATDLFQGPVVGLIKGWDSVQIWNQNGQNQTTKHPNEDLIEVKPVREGWVNCYRDGQHYGYASREEANVAAGIARIACIKIQFTEGEGL